MCRHIVNWHFCRHLVHKYEVCAFKDVPGHQEEQPVTIMPDTVCYLCYQPPGDRNLDRLRDSQLTIDQLAAILDFDTEHLPPNTWDMIATYFARGDHIRLFQPSVRGIGIEYPVDPVVQAIDTGDWATVYTNAPGNDNNNNVVAGGPGHAFDLALGEIEELEAQAQVLGLPAFPREEETPNVLALNPQRPRRQSQSRTLQSQRQSLNNTPPQQAFNNTGGFYPQVQQSPQTRSVTPQIPRVSQSPLSVVQTYQNSPQVLHFGTDTHHRQASATPVPQMTTATTTATQSPQIGMQAFQAATPTQVRQATPQIPRVGSAQGRQVVTQTPQTSRLWWPSSYQGGIPVPPYPSPMIAANQRYQQMQQQQQQPYEQARQATARTSGTPRVGSAQGRQVVTQTPQTSRLWWPSSYQGGILVPPYPSPMIAANQRYQQMQQQQQPYEQMQQVQPQLQPKQSHQQQQQQQLPTPSNTNSSGTANVFLHDLYRNGQNPFNVNNPYANME